MVRGGDDRAGAPTELLAKAEPQIHVSVSISVYVQCESTTLRLVPSCVKCFQMSERRSSIAMMENGKPLAMVNAHQTPVAFSEPFMASLLHRSGFPLFPILQAGRLHNSLALAAVGLAAFHASHPKSDPRVGVAYLASWTILFLGIYLINDVCDAKVDAVNKPWKPIPTHRISKTTATIIAAFAAPIGCLGLISVGYTYFDTPLISLASAAIGATALGIGYSVWIKSNCPLVANLVISAVVAICALIPIDFANAAGWLSRELPIYLLGLLGREYLKDVADLDADARGGRRTTALVYGPGSVVRLAMVLLEIALCWSIIGFAYAIQHSLLGLKFIAFSIACVISLCICIRNQDVRSINLAQSWLKPGLLCFLAIDVWHQLLLGEEFQL